MNSMTKILVVVLIISGLAIGCLNLVYKTKTQQEQSLQYPRVVTKEETQSEKEARIRVECGKKVTDTLTDKSELFSGLSANMIVTAINFVYNTCLTQNGMKPEKYMNTDNITEANDSPTYPLPTANTPVPPTMTIPEHSNGTNALDDFNARQAVECQTKTEAYTKCIEDFNSDMNRYLDCQQVNDDAKERYAQEMESYSRCMDGYQSDVDAYYSCLEHAANSPIRTYCSTPRSSCLKPMNAYSQYCQKPVNFCTKPYCY